MTLEGKGCYLWVISRVEGGNPNKILPIDDLGRLVHAEKIADTAAAAGLTHVLIKVADGTLPYNVRRLVPNKKTGKQDLIFNSTLGIDDCPQVVGALQRRGIQAWGWQYIYGRNPEAEADIAIRRINELFLDGFVVNAEVQFKAQGMEKIARRYMESLRGGVGPRFPIALSSFKFPLSHAPLPFGTFLHYCDYNMPQVYPIGRTDPRAHRIQLAQSLREYRGINASVPIIPTGGAFSESYSWKGKSYSWRASAEQVQDFFEACQIEGLAGGSIWEWFDARDRFAELWETMKKYTWPGTEPQPEHAPAAGDPIPVRFADGWMARLRYLAQAR